MSKKKKTFDICPCCGAEKYGLHQDKIHMDWERRCTTCGFTIELMPRSTSRQGYGHTFRTESDEFDVKAAGLTVGAELEDLFTNFSEQ